MCQLNVKIKRIWNIFLPNTFQFYCLSDIHQLRLWVWSFAQPSGILDRDISSSLIHYLKTMDAFVTAVSPKTDFPNVKQLFN